MDRKYTAQEMREASLWFYYQPNSTGKAKCFDRIEISAMLRQAADMMEREKKYEFSVKEFGGYVQPLHEDSVSLSFLDGRVMGDENYVIVRREVGAWEEVK